jgi:RNA polymerase sigma-70 factor (ECF subfamily)
MDPVVFLRERSNQFDILLKTQKDDVMPQGCTNRQMATNLYREYRSLVYWTAYPLLKNAQDAEDLTQDIFLGLLRNNQFNPERGSIVHFLRTMTRCRAIDRLRTKGVKQRAHERLGTILLEPTASPLDRAVTAERAEQVHRAMPRLSAHQRLVLELAYFRGLSQTQIAGYLNTPLGTVKSRVRNAQRVLRFHLSACR